MIIDNRAILKSVLLADAKNIRFADNLSNHNSSIIGYLHYFIKKIKHILFSNPISDQKYIWKYIKSMRYVEYYETLRKKHKFIYLFPSAYYHARLRKYARITGYQIPPFTCGKGLTIWHWGTIIVNGAAQIGDNCTLHTGVLLGHKKPNEGCPIVGNNVFIGAGTKIIGNITIGDNVIIGQNCVITKDIPANSVIVNGVILRNLK